MRFCIYLNVDDITECSAYASLPYRPTEFQQKEYCTTSAHTSCPFYSLAETDGELAAHQAMRRTT